MTAAEITKGRGNLRRHVALAVAALLVAGACSEGGPRWQELTGWRRDEVLAHPDVHEFDQVATAAGPGSTTWLTRTGNEEALSLFRMIDGGPVEETRLSMPEDRILIPVGVATDDLGWVAVAVTRDRPNGGNTGLVAWQGDVVAGSGSAAGAPPRPQRLRPSDGDVVPEGINAAHTAGTSVVAGLIDGKVVAWVSADGRPWDVYSPDLAVDADVVSIDLAAVGDRLVAAAVDDQGRGHLWTSPDGEEWAPVDAEAVPSGVSSVTALAPVGAGEIAIAWLRAGDFDDTDPRTGTSAVVQRFDGEALIAEGTIEARPDDGIVAFALDGAAVSPGDNLVVVGRALPSADAVAPMLWVRQRESWEPTSQPQLAGRLGAELREVTTTADGRMIALVTPSNHIDVELWRWVPAN